MARDYMNWNSSNPNRDSSVKSLGERPHVTNTVNGSKRYYSSVDAEIYFGDMFIDEVTEIQWAIQQQAMPIYGYNSYCFDDMALGSRLVQGQFAVNFTQAGFLTTIQKNKDLPRISRKLYGVDNKTESYFTDEFRQRLNMPVWDGGFDIVVGFGDHDKSNASLSNTMYSTYLVLDCCQITGSMVQLDYNGIPVQEIYTFMARDIKYNKATDTEKAPVTTPGNTVDRPELDLIGVFDLTTDLCKVKILNKDKGKLQSARVNILTPLSNQSLKTVMELTSNEDGHLIANLNKDKTKALSSEITTKFLEVIKCQCVISYYNGTSTSSNNGIATHTQNIDFEIKLE